MKHILSYKLFEAVILPPEIDDNDPITSIEAAIDFGRRHDFDVAGYDEFYNSLSEVDKQTAPPPFNPIERRGSPFFALFHPIRKRPMFVICDPNVFRFMPMGEIIRDIIGHERVHAEQSRRKGDIEYALPSPTDRKLYFSNKEEIMAFSFTIANEIKKESRDFEEAKDNFLKNILSRQAKMIWNEIKNVCDEEVIKRYRKYIYLYLEKMFDN